MTSICIFGDSIGEGYYDSKNGGWVAQLNQFLKTPNEKLHIYNCSISGESTREVLARFDVEIEARGSKTIIFALGINDSWYFNNDKNKPNVSLNNFKENINLLISKCKERKATIIFIGPTMVDESKVMPVPWRTEVFFDNKNIQKYNQTIKEICKEYKLTFIETYSLLQKEDLSRDGLHPNTTGHIKIFKKVKKYI
jgi:lysophospholipase L1-like esterase